MLHILVIYLGLNHIVLQIYIVNLFFLIFFRNLVHSSNASKPPCFPPTLPAHSPQPRWALRSSTMPGLSHNLEGRAGSFTKISAPLFFGAVLYQAGIQSGLCSRMHVMKSTTTTPGTLCPS